MTSDPPRHDSDAKASALIARMREERISKFDPRYRRGVQLFVNVAAILLFVSVPLATAISLTIPILTGDRGGEEYRIRIWHIAIGAPAGLTSVLAMRRRVRVDWAFVLGWCWVFILILLVLSVLVISSFLYWLYALAIASVGAAAFAASSTRRATL